jgi:hypothetical protein
MPPFPFPSGRGGALAVGPARFGGYEARAGGGRSTPTRSGSCLSWVPNGLAFTPLSQQVPGDLCGGGAVGPPEAAEPAATLVIATIRGLLLDLLATGDRDRDAAERFLATL